MVLDIPILSFLMGFYLLWAIFKNFRYCRRSFFYLPILQLLADWTVMSATCVGLFQGSLSSKF